MKNLTKKVLTLILTLTSLSAIANHERITCSGYPEILSIVVVLDSNGDFLPTASGGTDNYQSARFENCETLTSHDGYTLHSIKCSGQWSTIENEVNLHIARAQNGTYSAKFNRGLEGPRIEIGCIVER